MNSFTEVLKRTYPGTGLEPIEVSQPRMVERTVCADCGSGNWDEGWCHDECGGETESLTYTADANAFWRALRDA